MIRREKLHALILSRQHTGDADRRLVMFTKDYGLLHVLAKGVRRIPSRRGGFIEPLTHVIAIVSGHAGNYFLAAVETVNEYAALRADPAAAAHAHALAYFTAQLFREEEAQASVFDAVHHAWEILPHVAASKRAALEVAVAWHALASAGWMPQLEECLECRTREPQDAAVLDSSQGGWRCLSCHTSFAGTLLSLSPRLLRVARFLARHPERALQLTMQAEEAAQVLATLRSYIHEVIGTPLATPSSFAAARWQAPRAH